LPQPKLIFTAELSKLLDSKFTKKDQEFLFPQNPEAYKINRFDLTSRIGIIDDLTEQPIIAHVA
jgi:hypothetical protein